MGGWRREGRQLTLAEHLLGADCFRHILMHNLHDTPAISFSLQMKKLWLTKVQRRVYGHIGANWQKRSESVWFRRPCSYDTWLLQEPQKSDELRGQWNQPFPFPDIGAVAVGWQRRVRQCLILSMGKPNLVSGDACASYRPAFLPLSTHHAAIRDKIKWNWSPTPAWLPGCVNSGRTLCVLIPCVCGVDLFAIGLAIWEFGSHLRDRCQSEE